MEIERRWLIDAFPQQLPLLYASQMRQGYVATDPVVRIRESVRTDSTSYILCFKGEGTLSREEIEMPISQEMFQKLETFIGKPLIEKIFRAYRLPGGETLEVSLVDHNFFYAEVEFESVCAANAFSAPAFLGEEKTESQSFSMRRYWLDTRGNL